jgi:hypothetical protein
VITLRRIIYDAAAIQVFWHLTNATATSVIDITMPTLLEKIKDFFSVPEPKKPYPDWAYVSKTEQRLARVVDILIAYPTAYYFLTQHYFPAVIQGLQREPSPFESFLLDLYLEGVVGLLFLAGWWSLLALPILVLLCVCMPLAFYHLLFEASPLRASLGKTILGYKVVKKNGDPITFAAAGSRFGARMIGLPHLDNDDYDIVKRGAPRIN